MSDVDVFLYTYENDITLKEELQQLNDVVKLLDEIKQEMAELDEDMLQKICCSVIKTQI